MPVLPASNTTLPQGVFNHGDPNLVCTRTRWTDIVLFYAVNYIAHAVTVKSRPGEQMTSTLVASVLALIYPYSGIARGIEAMARHSNFMSGQSELQKAARAGALCVVVRSRKWTPLDGETFSASQIKVVEPPRATIDHDLDIPLEEIEPNVSADATWRVEIPPDYLEGFQEPQFGNSRDVHGIHDFPAAYELAVLPSNALVEPSFDYQHGEIKICSSYSLVKTLVAIGQVLSASVTLYRSRGAQIEQYGYAAFSLTITPYIVMSCINLLGNLFTPDFPTLYLVRSPEMAEAEARGARFDGVIGTVKGVPWVEEQHQYVFEEVDDGMRMRSVPEGSSQVTRSFNLEKEQCSEYRRRLFNRAENLLLEITFFVKGPTRTQEISDIQVLACGQFGTVGKQVWKVHHAFMWSHYCAFSLAGIPFAVIGGLTHFRAAHSTSVQRVFTMGWVVFGTMVGAGLPLLLGGHRYARALIPQRYAGGLMGSILRMDRLLILYMVVYSVPAIGGMVVVGQMLVEYGSCIRLNGL